MKKNNFFLNNYRTLNNLLVFIFFSFLFSATVKVTKKYNKNISYKLDLYDIPPDKIIVEQSLDSINLTVSSFGFNFIRHYLLGESINISVSNLLDNDKSFILSKSNAYQFVTPLIGADFELLSINFDNIYFKYDQLIKKNVPIILNSNLSYLPGYDSFNKFELSNDSVLVIGSQSKLNNIKFIETKNLILENLSENYNNSIELKIKDDQLLYSLNSVNISLKVDKSTESILSVPVKVINIPDSTRINFYPKYVDLSFNVSLQNYQLIKPEDFTILCDFEDVKSNGIITPFIKNKPKFIKNLKINSPNIQYVIIK